MHVDIDVIHELGVFGADGRRSLADLHPRDLAEGNGRAVASGDKHLGCDCLRVVAQRAGIADIDGKAFPAFDSRRHHLAAERRTNGLLQIAMRRP